MKKKYIHSSKTTGIRRSVFRAAAKGIGTRFIAQALHDVISTRTNLSGVSKETLAEMYAGMRDDLATGLAYLPEHRMKAILAHARDLEKNRRAELDRQKDEREAHRAKTKTTPPLRIAVRWTMTSGYAWHFVNMGGTLTTQQARDEADAIVDRYPYGVVIELPAFRDVRPQLAFCFQGYPWPHDCPPPVPSAP